MRSWLVLANRCSAIVRSGGLQLLTGYGLSLHDMPVEEDKVLESVKAAADPPAHCTHSKATTSSNMSFTPMKATHPTLPKPTPTSSCNKGKAAIYNVNHTGESSPAASARKHH
jgi:hypothetical protein